MGFDAPQVVGNPIAIKDEGVTLNDNIESIDFTGAGITGSNIGEDITEDVPGAAGGGDVTGPGSSTDNALVRFDSTTGKIIQNSVGILDDSGALSGLTQLDVDNIELDGNTMSATDTSGLSLLGSTGDGIFIDDNGTVGILTTDLTDSLFKVRRPDVDLLDQQQTISVFTETGTDWWQSFTAGRTGLLTRIDQFQVSGSSQTGTLSIYLGEGVGGTLLTSQAITAGAGAGFAQFPLITPVANASGVQYTFRFQTTGAFNQGLSNLDEYSGGRSSVSAVRDFVFKTYVDPGFDFVIRSDTDRVGINVPNPTETLDVGGNIKTSGDITTGGDVTVGANLITTNLTIIDSLDVGNLNLDDNIISATNTDGDISLIPDGIGGVGNVIDLNNFVFRMQKLDTQALDQQQLLVPQQLLTVTSWWQSFTPGLSGYLTQVDWFQFSAATTTGTLTIYLGQGVGGTVLSTEPMATGTGGQFQSIVLSKPPFLTSGVEYTFEIVTSAASKPGISFGTNPYSGGRSSFAADRDFGFKTFMATGFDFVIRRDTDRVGIDVVNPTEKLDVGGNINISSGSTYKIDGTEVLSVTTLAAPIAISKIAVDTTNVSNPPTDAELDSAFGAPATLETGFTAYINDNGAGNDFYQVTADGTNWWISTYTKAV